ncbi:rho guanine nucleotide exchange factor 15-like [Bombina bombina]|uniref:rho guanine nucleotide exchange factor 15-like n=1 Tax=Bombina bombina TaxID=8345 RepID=UPI00235A5A01|nr:rho guanine nucleotide exchange factor 15-like [Bombina bombina]
MSATDALPPPIALSQKPQRIIKARPPNRPPPHLPPKPPQKLPPCPQTIPDSSVSNSSTEHSESSTSDQPTSNVNVKRIAGLFQRDSNGNAEEENPSKGHPKSQGKRSPVEKKEDQAKVQVEKEDEQGVSCPPPLPPKLFQDTEDQAVKMGSCPLRRACSTRCQCACHQHRPGMVLIWIPESSLLLDHNTDISDSSDDGGVLQRTVSVEDDGGKWGSRLLRNRIATGSSYPVRRRSQVYSYREGKGEGGAGDERARSSVVLTSYKSTSDDSFNGELTASSPEKSDGSINVKTMRFKFDSSPESLTYASSNGKVKVNGDIDSSLDVVHSENPSFNAKFKNESTKEFVYSQLPSTGCSNGNVSCPEDVLHTFLHTRDSSVTKNDSAPAIPLSETHPDTGLGLNGELHQTNVIPFKNSKSTDTHVPPELPSTEAPPLRASREDGQVEMYTKVRKPARRSKVPLQSLSGSVEPPSQVPPKVPSKPPRGTAPPPPPFVRKGSLKLSGKMEEQKANKGSSLPTCELHRSKESSMDSDEYNGSGDAVDISQDNCDVFRFPTLKSSKSIDWESHLRDEPLYQTYRQTVIKKEIQRQNVPRNSSFTSYDSSHDSPSSSNGSPRLGRRSAANHNTLWQELPAVKESGVLEHMTNEQKKMQESMFEVLTSEASYLRSLNVLTEHFLGSRELEETLIIREKKILFSNILKVKEVSERFLVDLEARVDESILISDVCDIIYHHALHHFPVYIDYVRNQLYQEKTYSELMEKSPQFYAAICRLQELPQCHRLPFMSFLLLPFQRITRIKMLIENILKRTEEGSESEENATKALNAVAKIIQECNREVGRMKQTEELIHIAQKIEFDKIKVRILEIWNTIRFSDRYIVLDYAHRSLVQLQSCPTIDNSFFLTLLENHQGKTSDRLFKAPTQSDLHRWVAAFPSQNDDDLSSNETIYEDWDCPQVQCVDFYTAAQTDELSLEPADIINVLRKTSEGWYEGIRLADGRKGWFPSRYVQEITNEHVRRRNLRERHRVLQAARQIQLSKVVEHKKKSSSA